MSLVSIGFVELIRRTLEVVGLIQAPQGSGRVHSLRLGVVGFILRTLEVLGFIRVRWVLSGAPRGSLGWSGLLDLFRGALRVVGLVQVCCVQSGGSGAWSGSFDFVVFNLARPRGRVHSAS